MTICMCLRTQTFWFDKNVTIDKIRIFFFVTFASWKYTIIFVNFDTSNTASFSDLNQESTICFDSKFVFKSWIPDFSIITCWWFIALLCFQINFAQIDFFLLKKILRVGLESKEPSGVFQESLSMDHRCNLA